MYIAQNKVKKNLPSEIRERVKIKNNEIFISCDGRDCIFCRGMLSNSSHSWQQQIPIDINLNFKHTNDPLVKAILKQIGKMPKCTIVCDIDNFKDNARGFDLLWEKDENRLSNILRKYRDMLNELNANKNPSFEEVEQINRIKSGITELERRIEFEREQDLNNRLESRPPIEYCKAKNKDDIPLIVEGILKAIGGQ